MLSVVQLTVVPLISIGSIIPDLLIVLVVTYTLFYGQLFGTVFGAVSGLIFDLISGGVLGSAMFSKTLSAFVAGYFYSDNKIEYNTATSFMLIVVFISASLNSFFYLLITASEIKLTAAHLFLEQGVLPGIYTALFALPVILLNQRRGEL
jgi:rod shape-determining protein MreD